MRSRSRSGAGDITRRPSISIASPDFSLVLTVTRVALSFSRGSKAASTARSSRASALPVEVAGRSAGEGRHAEVHHAAPHLGEVGERRGMVGRRPPPRAAVSMRHALEALGVEQDLDVAAHRLAEHVGGNDDAARLDLGPAALLRAQPREPLLLPRVERGIAVQRPAASGEERLEPLLAKLLRQRLAQAGDLRGDARADR